jgi:hypothetical protein
MIPPYAPQNTRQVVWGLFGTQYVCSNGATIDAANADVPTLQGQGWIAVAPSGPTSARPAFSSYSTPVDGLNHPGAAGAGQIYLDTSLSLLIVGDGQVWRNPATGAIV